jgi:hypothetical protein
LTDAKNNVPLFSMVRLKRQRRKLPTEIEIAANRARLVRPPLQILTDGEDLKLDEAVADQAAIIQRSWDEETAWLRSVGVAHVPQDLPRDDLVEELRNERCDRIIPFVRVFKCDRWRFKHRIFARSKYV